MKWDFLHLFGGTSTAWWQELLPQLVAPAKSLITIATPNPEQVVLALRQPAFARALNAFRYQLPDGIGLVWASRWRGERLGLPRVSQRITGVSVVKRLLSEAREHRWSVLIVGGRGYVQTQIGGVQVEDVSRANMTGRNLTNHYVYYWIAGFENARQPKPEEQHDLEQIIAKIQPKLIFVALGAPEQENWIITHQQFLHQQGVRLAMTAGGAFDMLTGRLRRAPRWVKQLHLEWLFRLIQEPRRWRRQLALLEFVWRAIQ